MINRCSNISFKGYDAMPLRGFYMQGIRQSGEKRIFNEMKAIAQQEGVDIFVNQDGQNITQELNNDANYDEFLSVWGQDNKAFVVNKNGRELLCKSKEPALNPESLGKLSDFELNNKKYIPRGGNYYIGYKNSGEKWLLINGITICNEDSFKKYGENPTINLLPELFDVKPENIHILTDFTNDIDEIVRPIGYPNILVNDYKLSLENLDKMKKYFPNSEIYLTMKNYLLQRIREGEKNLKAVPSTDKICEKLKSYGFNPIRIGGRYIDGINYMNALAFENKKNGFSYITNSTKNSYPELEYLESLFEKDLKQKVPKITDTYFVSGGKRDDESVPGLFNIFYNKGFKKQNVIMDILATRGGGIHCMTAEIPDFNKL